MQKILFLGGTGLLGSYLVKSFTECCEYKVIIHGFNNKSDFQVDITNSVALTQLLDLVKPDIIFNLVALTDVEKCEINPANAFLLNTRIVLDIANWLKSNTYSHLIHISTDHVYDAQQLNREEDVLPKNYYAYSKYAGELSALGSQTTILRTNFFGKGLIKSRESITDWLLRILKERECAHVFDDVFFSPISMKSLSYYINLIAKIKPIGTFNLGSNHGMSKAEFAFSFANACRLNSGNLTPSSVHESKNIKVYRPKDMRMNNSKIESLLHIKMNSLEEEIGIVSREYKLYEG